MSEALYLYGFLPAGGPAPPDDLQGIAHRPVETIEEEGVRAAVSRVPADEYASHVVESRMHEIPWLTEQGALHERVVTWFVDHGGIVPVRLLTLYSSPAALATEIRPRRDRIRGTLERLEGLREWDLKVSYDAERMGAGLGRLSEEVGALDREIADAPPGRRFLLEKKRAGLLRGETARAARELGRRVLEALEPLAREARSLPPPREVEENPVVVNAAFLVAEADETELRGRAEAEADRVEEHGMTVDLTGPWAPYRFVNETGDRAPDAEAEGGGDG